MALLLELSVLKSITLTISSIEGFPSTPSINLDSFTDKGPELSTASPPSPVVPPVAFAAAAPNCSKKWYCD